MLYENSGSLTTGQPFVIAELVSCGQSQAVMVSVPIYIVGLHPVTATCHCLVQSPPHDGLHSSPEKRLTGKMYFKLRRLRGQQITHLIYLNLSI